MPLLNPNSLLTNPLAMAGLGLLSQPTRSRNPQNPMAAVFSGVQMAGQNQMAQQQLAGQQAELQMRQQKMKFEMEEALRKREQEAVEEARKERERQAIEAEIAKLPPEQQAIARLNSEAYAKGAAGSMFKPPEEKWSAPYVDNSTGKPMLVQKSESTGELRSVGSGGVTVNMGETAKPVGDKASKYIMPDGSIPSPLMSVEEIVAAGGQVLSPAQVTEQNRKATIDADDDKLAAQVEAAQRAYDEAAKAYDAAKTPETFRELNNAAAKLQTAIAGRENWRGEPSDGVANRFTVPGPVRKTAEDLLTPVLESLGGGKPKVRKYNPQTGMIE